MSADDLAARLYEAVADDESMRGSLTDAGYAPILKWAAARASYLVDNGRGIDFDTLASTLRAAIGALVAAAESDDPTELTGIDPLVASPAAVAAITEALVRAPEDPDARAQVMANTPIDGLAT